MPAPNFQGYFPDGRPTSPPAVPPFFPGASVPPIYKFPFIVNQYPPFVPRVGFYLASPGTLPALPTTTLPFFLQTSPISALLWNVENAASSFDGPLYSPNLKLTGPSQLGQGGWPLPTRPFPWGSGHDAYRVWRLINAIAGITNEPSPSMPSIFPDYPDIKMVVIGYNAILAPVDYDYSNIEAWFFNGGIWSWWNAPDSYWALGLSIGFYSAHTDGTFSYDQTPFFYPGAKDMTVGAGDENDLQYGAPTGTPNIYFWDGSSVFPGGFTGTANFTFGNTPTQQIVPATNDYTVQKPRLVPNSQQGLSTSKLLELIVRAEIPYAPNTPYAWFPSTGPNLPANSTVVANGSVIPTDISWAYGIEAILSSPVSMQITNPIVVRHGSYQPPITKVVTNGGLTFYVL